MATHVAKTSWRRLALDSGAGYQDPRLPRVWLPGTLPRFASAIPGLYSPQPSVPSLRHFTESSHQQSSAPLDVYLIERA